MFKHSIKKFVSFDTLFRLTRFYYINDFPLWSRFGEIHSRIKENYYKTSETLKNDTHEWMKMYLCLYHVDNVSVYMHIFASHLHEFIDLYGNINLFNCEGLEKLNDYSTLEYYRSTNKKGKVTNQILHHRMRVLFFENNYGPLQQIHSQHFCN